MRMGLRCLSGYDLDAPGRCGHVVAFFWHHDIGHAACTHMVMAIYMRACHTWQASLCAE